MPNQTHKRTSLRRARAERAVADLAWLRDELHATWRAAHDDAVDAYRAWTESGGVVAYTAYRAEQDRADAAQDKLAENHP